MCLISKTPIPSIAQEDIICYKMFEVNPIWKELLMTPYMLKSVKSNEFPFIFIASSNKCVTPIYVPWTKTIHYEIGPGFIHAYTSEILLHNLSSRFCTVLCKIPKRTKYYVSMGGEEICASEMELIRIL